jgi:hypothetical protein
MARENHLTQSGYRGSRQVGGKNRTRLHFFGGQKSPILPGSEKEDAKVKGILFHALNDLLSNRKWSAAALTGIRLLHDPQFKKLEQKELFKRGTPPAWEEAHFLTMARRDNLLLVRHGRALGGEHLLNHPNVSLHAVATGRTRRRSTDGVKMYPELV